MPLLFRRHPIHGLPFDGPLANELRAEYLQLPAGQRANALRKALQRELLLHLTGQARRRVAHVPAEAQCMLWIYTWTTVGDSLMDLAVRTHLPPGLQIDLLIDPALASLYAGDPHFRNVLIDPQDARGPFDFVLLQDLSTASLRLKRRCAPAAPFATVFEHLRGERFDRLGFAQRRAEQLFGIPVGDPARPTLHLPADRASSVKPANLRIAVALGARDPRRRYGQWPQVLQLLVDGWPARWAPPRFVLLGTANALDDLAAFPPWLLERHTDITIGRLDLLGTAAHIRDCDAFLGADGGLMHLAVALDKPGAAVFVEIDPRQRLLSNARIRSLFTPLDINRIAPADIAAALLATLPDPAH